MNHQVRRYLQLSTHYVPPLIAGAITVLIGFTASVAIVFQAAQAAQASPEQLSSWLLALGLGMGATCIGLSWYYKMPIVTAWSTPGAALLATSLHDLPMSETIGAFIVSAVLMTVMGVTGWFAKIMHRIPLPLASAMLAGILFKFCANAFLQLKMAPWIVASMLLTYLIAKQRLPRYAILLMLLMGMSVAYGQHLLHFEHVQVRWASPEWIMPTFSWHALVSIALPLLMVNMASQQLPGVAMIRSAGYVPPISPLITVTGLTTLLLAPMGAFAICIAAVTAAIPLSPEAHPDKEKRYLAGIFAGMFYTITGLLGATIVALFAAFPPALIIGLAGMALFGTLANGLTVAMSNDMQREAALITFLVTASGLQLFGIGSAFWGLVMGGLTLAITHYARLK